jgi:epsilon-lactone hydrolase
LRAAIAAPYRVPAWDADPKSAAEWKELISNLADAGAQARREARERLGVTMEPAAIGGVKAFILTPKEIPADNRNRLLIHVHGGGYVYNPGEAGTSEGTLMAAYGGFKVISIDYRMPPDFPYPAAMDDAMAVWREAIKLQDPHNMAIFGTSTGGGMTLAMILRAKQENLPLPAAIAPGTPWSDLTETGDTFKTNEWLDNVFVSYNGYLVRAAKLYANGHDLKDLLSGGTMERPALQCLLDDIAANLIDVVVVYKVDRLTRSLTDFAKLVEIFEARGVSFVSGPAPAGTALPRGDVMTWQVARRARDTRSRGRS